MAKPVRRSDIVQAVITAAAILDKAIPLPSNNPAIAEDRQVLRAAAMPVVLRELLDHETEP